MLSASRATGRATWRVWTTTIGLALAVTGCAHHGRASADASSSPSSGTQELPDTVRCGAPARRELARLVRAARTSSDTAYLERLVVASSYPDAGIADAAGSVVADRGATVVARVSAIAILLMQARGWRATLHVVDRSSGAPASAYGFGGPPLRCQIIALGDILQNAPAPPPDAEERVNRVLTNVARSTNDAPGVRHVAACAAGLSSPSS